MNYSTKRHCPLEFHHCIQLLHISLQRCSVQLCSTYDGQYSTLSRLPSTNHCCSRGTGTYQSNNAYLKQYIMSSPGPKAHRRAYRIPMVRRPSLATMLKDLLLRNRWANQCQILCGASLGRVNESLFAASGSHDQDGRHAHIW